MANYHNIVKDNLTFQEAYAAFMEGKIVRRWSNFYTVYTNASKEEDMNEAKFSIADIKATDWQILEVNWDLEDKLDAVRMYVEDAGLDIDTRFYDLYKMDIGEIFNLITDSLDTETMYNIIMLLKEKGFRFDDK